MGSLPKPEPFVPHPPDYIKELRTKKTERAALRFFEANKNSYKDLPYYFLDVARYFRKQWDNEQKSDELLAFVGRQFSDEVAVQRALAYNYEELEKYDKALESLFECFKTQIKGCTVTSRCCPCLCPTGQL